MHTLRIAGSTDGSRRATRLRSTLVAIEVGLLVVLLACAALMQRTLTYLAGVDPGFRAGRPHGRAARAARPAIRSETPPPGSPRVSTSRSSDRATRTAALAWPFDYTGFSWAPNIDLPATPFPDGQQPVAQAATVTPDYFETMGIPLLRGRNFGPLDRRGSPVVAIVSQSFVRRFFPDADPIGQRVSGVRDSGDAEHADRRRRRRHAPRRHAEGLHAGDLRVVCAVSAVRRGRHRPRRPRAIRFVSRTRSPRASRRSIRASRSTVCAG